MTKEALRKEISELVEKYAAMQYAEKIFVAGETVVPPSGKVIRAKELQYMVEASLDGWLTAGRFNEAFEKKLGEFYNLPHVLTTTSGSSANLLALTALTSPTLGKRALKPGDEMITVAAGFPTTVNPAVQNGLIPVFIDIDQNTYNINASDIESSVTDKTKIIMIAHTLGNTFDLTEVKRVADKYNLWLIEDCCDALGSTYDGKLVGTFGDIATLSFYPAHHITMGEGGALLTKSAELKTLIESFRDWGRDCYCEPGCDNTCGKRFEQQLGSLPQGYDHKYTYSHLGYNLKISDMQAACGLAQLESVEQFIDDRKANFKYLKNALKNCDEFIELPEPTDKSDPSWFGFPITLKESSNVDRVELLKYLDECGIGTRLIFAGNLTRQPYFEKVKYRVHSELTVTDRVMNQAFWLGVYPGLTTAHLDYVVEKMEEFFGIGF